MKILVDADACPRAVKEILFRAVQRLKIPTTLIANQYMRVPLADHIDSIAVAAGPDEADDRIVELAEAGDLVITADIPLADRVVAKGATALDPRGTLLTAANIKERLATRDLLDELRSAALVEGGPSSYGARDSQAFANQLNQFLQSRPGG
ncbi:MAG: YaiI/YqxD family protein [bacterium]|nr:YaiI/YqxD family protein [bacterium]